MDTTQQADLFPPNTPRKLTLEERAARFHEENLNKNVELLSVIDGIAEARSLTQSQVALAWNPENTTSAGAIGPSSRCIASRSTSCAATTWSSCRPATT